jgi:serine/threonine protein kinase
VKKPIPFGKYYLLDRISVGGMAEVFKAKAFGVEGFERLIAVKRILPSIAEDEEFITMFIDEAKIAVQLTHANIAQIFDLGKVGDSFFIALEYVAGKDLRAIFDRLRKNGQTVPIPMAAYIVMKVCEGLDYAHNKKDGAGRDLNLVHRDVSPQNVLISYDGESKLIDFGIAKAAGKAGKTQAGILKGKFGYMSPEQVRGLPLDRRSDIFAVGICLWELVTGERLFVGESDFSTLEKVRNVEITPPSAFNKRIPEELEKIILKALSKEVEDRYQSAMDLHDDLQSWMYTSGNFFARKDLAAFMSETFREDIEREAASSEGAVDIARSTVPPPPRVARTGSGRGPSRPGAPPPPPRASVPPPPPPRPTGSGPMPRATGSGPSPRATVPGRGPGPPMPGRPGAGPPRPPARKRTMMGMPAVQMPGAPGPGASAPPPPPPRASGTLPPDLSSGQVATPMGTGPGVAMEDWDEDEPPTNIYDKQQAAEMAQAQVAGRAPRPGPPPPPPSLAPPPTFEEEPAEPVKRKKSIVPLLAGIGGGVVVAAAAAVVLVLFVFGKSEAGTVQLQVNPADKLQVIVDGTIGVPFNASPMTIADLKPGRHVLLIKRDGYKDAQETIDVESGETVARAVQLEALAAQSGFFLDTVPAGADVFVDDRPIEDKTPVTVTDLEPGKHMVRVSKGDAFAQLNLEVEVVDGQITKLPTKTLDLKEVKIEVEEPKGAKLALLSGKDRKELGTIPVDFTIDTAKEYKLEYSKKGYKTLKKNLEYEPGKEHVVLAALTLEGTGAASKGSGGPSKPKGPKGPKGPSAGAASGPPGKLSVQTKPWSTVFINGKKIKNTPLVNYSLKPGTYTVTVENPTYNIRKTYRVKIKPGATTTLVKTLI